MKKKSSEILYYAEGVYTKNKYFPLSRGYKTLTELRKVIKTFGWKNYWIVKETIITEIVEDKSKCP